MVIQDTDSTRSDKNVIALLKLAALGRKSVERGSFKRASKAFQDIEKRRNKRRG